MESNNEKMSNQETRTGEEVITSPPETKGSDEKLTYEEEEEYEPKGDYPEDPYAEDANTTSGEPYFAFFAALIVMALMLAVWLFSALYFGRWNLI